MFGDKYEYLETLSKISDKWFTILSLHKFLEGMVKDIAQAMSLNHCNFILYNDDGGYYEMDIDKEIFKQLVPLYFSDVNAEFHPSIDDLTISSIFPSSINILCPFFTSLYKF